TYYTCSSGYQCGHLQSITNALGQSLIFNSYNAYGQPIQSTDINGVITTNAYDSHQRLTARCVNGLLPACTGGELTAYAYWPTSKIRSVTYPDGSSILLSYDPAHRLTQITDNAGNYVAFTLDPLGNRVAESVYDATNTLRRTHT